MGVYNARERERGGRAEIKCRREQSALERVAQARRDTRGFFALIAGEEDYFVFEKYD